MKLSERIKYVVDGVPISTRKLSRLAVMSPGWAQKLTERDAKRPDTVALGRLADALGLPRAWLVDGEGDPPPLGLKARGESPRVVLDSKPPASRDGTPLQRALAQAFDASRRHLPMDMEKVGEAMGNFMRKENVEGDLVEAARLWLDAAAAMRREDEEVTAESLLLRLTVGKGQLAAAAGERRGLEFQGRVDARVAQFDAADGDDVDPVDAAAVARLKASAAKPRP